MTVGLKDDPYRNVVRDQPGVPTGQSPHAAPRKKSAAATAKAVKNVRISILLTKDYCVSGRAWPTK